MDSNEEILNKVKKYEVRIARLICTTLNIENCAVQYYENKAHFVFQTEDADEMKITSEIGDRVSSWYLKQNCFISWEQTSTCTAMVISSYDKLPKMEDLNEEEYSSSIFYLQAVVNQVEMDRNVTIPIKQGKDYFSVESTVDQSHYVTAHDKINGDFQFGFHEERNGYVELFAIPLDSLQF